MKNVPYYFIVVCYMNRKPEKKLIEESIIKTAKAGRISCAALRKIAEKHNTSYRSAGKVADELKIKIKNCDLGCF